MFLKKSKEEVLKEALDTVAEYTSVTNLQAGGIARSIIESVGGEFESLYEVAEYVLHQGYLSKADDEHLDLFGEMFNYPRRTETVRNEDTGEYEEELIDEETYRYELSKQVTASVSSNEESVRLAALLVTGVQNIQGIEYSHGTGSFSFVLTVQNGFDEEEVRDAVEEEIEENKAYGIKSNILLPKNISLQIEVQLILKEQLLEEDSIKYKVQNTLNNYFGDFRAGQEFIYNDFVQQVMSADDQISDFHIKSFLLEDRPVLLTNHSILEEERIRPKLIEIF